MARVTLEILRGPYRPALAGGLQVESCRLLTDLSLQCGRAWTPFLPGIVDTGAPLSLLPRRVWQSADVSHMGRILVGGLNRRQECMFEVTLAVVVLAIRDRFNENQPVEAHALLADTDDVPTLLGMRGVLTELVLHTDIRRGEAYVETTQNDPTL